MTFNDLKVVRGSTFDPKQGVRAIDGADGDVTDRIVITGAVDTTKLGEYTITYTVDDTSGNSTVANRKVTVVDTGGPTILGAENCNVEHGATFDARAGVTATDAIDGDVTASLVVEGTVDTSTLGAVNITYKAYDSSNNETVKVRVVTVVDTVAPVLEGVSDVEVEVEPVPVP